MIIAFDPGRNVGVAYVALDGSLSKHKIIDLGAVKTLEFPAGATIIIGDGTGSRAIQDVLNKLGLDFSVVDEKGSSLEARALYFSAHPPKGLKRLLPKGMWSPERPIDDYAAYAIALRYLQKKRPG